MPPDPPKKKRILPTVPNLSATSRQGGDMLGAVRGSKALLYTPGPAIGHGAGGSP
jgi:hypothetical protein